MEKKIKKPKFLIVSPPQNWGGPVVLHLLCRMLSEYGYESKVFLLRMDVRYPRSRQEFLQQYLPFMNNKAEQKLDSQQGSVKGCELTNWPYVDDDTVVVYPEVIFGNPLAAKHVVRWFLNVNPFKGNYTGEQPYGRDDLFICYLQKFNDNVLNPTGRQVQLIYFNYDVYKRTNYGTREGSCFIVRKGSKRPDLPSNLPGIIIDRLSEEEKVEVMNKCKYCYSYDTQTLYAAVAAVCGCISIVVPEPGKKREDYLDSDEKGWGVAYGDSPEEIDFACRTQKELQEWLESFKVRNHENVKNFLGYCKEYFQGRMGADINW